jgi:hypothetical protein
MAAMGIHFPKLHNARRRTNGHLLPGIPHSGRPEWEVCGISDSFTETRRNNKARAARSGLEALNAVMEGFEFPGLKPRSRAHLPFQNALSNLPLLVITAVQTDPPHPPISNPSPPCLYTHRQSRLRKPRVCDRTGTCIFPIRSRVL